MILSPTQSSGFRFFVICFVSYHCILHNGDLFCLLSLHAACNDSILSYLYLTGLMQALKHLEISLSSSKFFMVLDDIQDSSQSDKDEIGQLLLNRMKDIPMGSKLLFLARWCSAECAQYSSRVQ